MKRSNWIKLGVAITLLALLFWHVDLQQFPAMLRGADPLFLILCLLFSLLMVAASCWKWWLILRLQQCPIPFLRLYRWYFIGYFYSNFLPSNIGGDVARAWFVRAQSKSGSIGVVSVFAERLTGIIVLLLLAASLPFVLRGPWQEPTVWIVSLSALALLLAVLLILLMGEAMGNSPLARRVLVACRRTLCADIPGDIGHRMWTRTAHLLQRLHEQGRILTQALRRHPRALLHIIALTLLFYGLTIINVALAYRAFGIWPPLRELASLLPVALLVGMIPLSLGNLGIAEGSYVYYFGLAGMAAELTLMVALFLRFKMLTLGLIGWIVQLGCPAPRNDNEQHYTTKSAHADADRP